MSEVPLYSASAGYKRSWGLTLEITSPPRLTPCIDNEYDHTRGYYHEYDPCIDRMAPPSSSSSTSSARAVRRRWAAPPLDAGTFPGDFSRDSADVPSQNTCEEFSLAGRKFLAGRLQASPLSCEVTVNLKS